MSLLLCFPPALVRSIATLTFLADDTSPDSSATFLCCVCAFAVFIAVIALSFDALLRRERRRVAEIEEVLSRKERDMFAWFKSNWAHHDAKLEKLAAAKKRIELANQIVEVAQQKKLAELAAKEQQIEQQRHTLAIATQAADLNKSLPKNAELRERSQAIRAEQFFGSAASREIFVTYFLDPQNSGAVVFEWEMNTNHLVSPALVISRNGTMIRCESGIFKGKLGSVVLKRNKRYCFEFKVSDGKQEFARPLLVELTIPGFDAGPALPKPQPMPDQTKEKWIAENVARMKRMKTWPADEKGRKEAMAKLQAEALKKFGEAE